MSNKSLKTAQQLIASMRVDSLPNIYFVGPYTKRINFASQQTRALNLIWALSSTGKLPSNAKVAVIGAGLAGITAAAALKRLGHSVTIYEARKKGGFPIQKNSAIRYTHPTLNFWPEVDLDPGANFPFFYWTADICSEVISAVLRQHHEELSGIEIADNSEVARFDINQAKKPSLDMKRGALLGPFDAVIVATGFLPEVCLEGTTACSYWDNDDFVKPSGRAPSSFLICGAGDGGLLEVLRLAYEDFDNGKLTERVARQLDRTSTSAEILAIEQESRTKRDFKEACESLRKAYLKLTIPADLAGRLNPVGSITLLARGGAAFLPTSAPVHRVMLARAIQAGAVSVEDGELISMDGTLRCINQSNVTRNVKEDVVVRRYGARRAIEALLNEQEWKALSEKQRVLSEYQFGQSWPRDYFSLRKSTKKAPDRKRENDEMVLRIRTAHHLLKEFKGATGYEIRRRGKSNELGYFIATTTDLNEFKRQALPQILFGRPLGVVKTSFRASSTESSGGLAKLGDRRALQVGDYIRVSQAQGRTREGTVGCIIESGFGDDLIALTADHIFLERSGDSVYARSPLSEKWAFVGEVVEVPRRPGELGWDDVGAIKLDRKIEVEPTVAGLAISRIADPLALIGHSVRRVTAGGNTVVGEVEGVGIGLEIRLPNGRRRSIANAIIVSGLNGASFSAAGDSGSLVFTSQGEALGVIVATDDNESLVAQIEPTISRFGGRLATSKRSGYRVIPEAVQENEPAQLVSKEPPLEHSPSWSPAAFRIGTIADPFLARRAHVHEDGLSADYFDRELAIGTTGVAFWGFRPLFRMLGLASAIDHLRIISPSDLQPFTAQDRPVHLRMPDLTDIEIPRGHGTPTNVLLRAAQGHAVTLVDATSISMGIVKAAAKASADKSEDLAVLENFLAIEPAIFRLRNLESGAAHMWEKLLEQGLIDYEFSGSLKQLITEMVGGRLVTHRTASLLFQILTAFGIRIGPVEMADDSFLRRASAARTELQLLGGFDAFLARTRE